MVSSACAQEGAIPFLSIESKIGPLVIEGATELNSSFYRYPLPTHYRLISITPSHVERFM